MLGSLIVAMALATLPRIDAPQPPAECALDVLTPQALDDRARAEFNRGVDEYVRLHRRLERYLPPPQMFDDPDARMEAADALADALRAARPDARPGHLFSAGPAQLFRTIIDATLRADRGRGAWMPALLHALPPLPHELEYRLVKHDLILFDVHAALVVDVLENAMPADDESGLVSSARWRSRSSG